MDPPLNRPPSLSRRRRQLNSTNDTTTMNVSSSLEYLDRPVQFIVMQVGNLSLNTPPVVAFPTLSTQEEDPLTALSLQQYVTDMEGDTVQFRLQSVPRLGTVNLTATGLLSYSPCANCFGQEMLEVVVTEVMFDDNHIPLSVTSTLNITITDSGDNPVLFFYDGLGRDDTDMLTNLTIAVAVETNRTGPMTIAKVGAYDVDGSENFIELSPTGTEDSIGYEPWLRAFTVAQSLPVSWPTDSNLFNFTGFLAFYGANITYQAAEGLSSDVVQVNARDTSPGREFAPRLTINIDIIPSWCQNGGLCGGSLEDPNCTNITTRREDPSQYRCTCLAGYSGTFCEVSLTPVVPTPEPGKTPMF